ncbi:MAG: methionine--tRNA ligase [Chloroflexota bacterium]|nr:methionine--tRNA ligase [Chloroflexota bacterium]
MAGQKFYLTTAIAYVNSLPGLHHAYEFTGADALARFHRQRGREVYFVTGTDENATKNEKAAAEAGEDTRTFVDRHAAAFKRLCDQWSISYDRFIRTTDADHVAAVQEFVRRWIANGDVYLAKYEGLYCTRCEAFYEESDLIDGRCEFHPQNADAIQRVEEENFFFRLSRYEGRLRELYAKDPDFCLPEIRRNEVLGWLDRGLRDVSVSRRNLKWGIPFPDHPEHTVYVWFDALINYVTAAGFGTDEAKFAHWWPCDVHVIGKDISRFHCLYWPAMLMAAGIELPKRVFVHGFLEYRGQRLSKSSGNMIDPIASAEQWGVDATRYLLLREAPFEKDTPISPERLDDRFNADLANGLGNLVQRTLKMCELYCESRIPAPDEPGETDAFVRTAAEFALSPAGHDQSAAQLRFAAALDIVFDIVAQANRHYQATQPWQLAKDPSRRAELETALYTGLEAVRVAAYLLWPYMPAISTRIVEQLGGVPPEHAEWSSVGRWGVLRPGDPVRVGAPLFPRLEPAPA